MSGRTRHDAGVFAARAAKAAVSGPFRIAQATLELESASCADDSARCAMFGVDRLPSGHLGHSH